MLELVRTAAERLVNDLQQGEAETRGWRDPDQSAAIVHAALQSCLEKVASSECWGEANRLPSGELWRIAGAWLEQGALQQHARLKPRGYAGDFEMLEKICTGWLSSGGLGRACDQFFQNQAAPRAVRNRTELCAEAIVRCVQTARSTTSSPSSAVRVVSIGSGPGHDVYRAVTRMDPAETEGWELTLLDLDPAALEFASNRVIQAGFPSQNLHPVRENLFRIGQPQRAADLFGGADLVICSGLFDYLQAEHAAEMLQAFSLHAKPDARILVYNFSAGNSSRAYMEWIGNWYLIYRDPETLRQMASDAGFAKEEMQVGRESTGASLFLDLQKPSG